MAFCILLTCILTQHHLGFAHHRLQRIALRIQLSYVSTMKHIIYLATLVSFTHGKTAGQLCAGTAKRASDGN